MLPQALQGQLAAAQSEVEDLRQANELKTWRGVSQRRFLVGRKRWPGSVLPRPWHGPAATATTVLRHPSGPGFKERLRGLSARIWEVARHGIRHGAAAALTATLLRLRDSIDLCRVTPGLSSEKEMSEGVNVEQVIAGFSGFADAIVAVIDVEQAGG